MQTSLDKFIFIFDNTINIANKVVYLENLQEKNEEAGILCLKNDCIFF